MYRNVVFTLGILGALLFIIPSILGGLWIEGYSFIGQYISESFATGVPNAEYLRYMYMGSGVLLLIFSLLTPKFFPKSRGTLFLFLVFGLFYGLGNVVVALFPCDAGCPTGIEDSSLAQLVHNASAFLTYAVVPFCMIGLGFLIKKREKESVYSKVSIACGILALIFVLLLFSNPKVTYVGLLQRIVESSILFWVIFTAFSLKKR